MVCLKDFAFVFVDLNFKHSIKDIREQFCPWLIMDPAFLLQNKGCPDDSVQKKPYIFPKNIMNFSLHIDRFGVPKNQLSIEFLIY